MLEFDEPGLTPKAFCVTGATERRVGLNARDGYLCAVIRILQRGTDRCDCAATRLLETVNAQWQLFVFCAAQAVARRSRVTMAKPAAAAPIRAAHRGKAFFVSRKVNGRNAP